MIPGKGRRALAAWLSLFHLVFALVATPPAFAQPVEDGEPPRIEFEPLVEGRRGDIQVFSARVSDDVGVESVTLRYRLSPDASYRSKAMSALAGTSIYTASIDSPDGAGASIQYYIEARDASGNRSIEGFAFDPLERRLVEDPAPVAAQGAESVGQSPTAVRADGMSTGRKVLYGVLGVIAIGALAAATGGGGSDGGSPQSDDPDVPVTFVIDPLR